MDKIPIIAVVGPTASGKTKLSIELAKAYNAEIVSSDSMQIYKNMDIANASPTVEEKGDIVHHMLNFLDPSQRYSVADYVEQAHKVIKDIHTRGKHIVLVGGTGFYIDSLLNNTQFVDFDLDEELREKLYALYEQKSIDYLLDLIKEFDFDSYLRLKDEKNLKRIIRCIEIYRQTGITQTQQNINSKLIPSPYFPIKIGLKCQNRQILYDRINYRVDEMIKNGLVDEAKDFFSNEYSNTSSMAIGYKELKPYLDGECSLDDCVDNLKMQTRRYAKRQLTWFSRDINIRWFDIDTITFQELIELSKEYIEENLDGKQ